MDANLFLWLWGPFAVTFVTVAVLLINHFDRPRNLGVTQTVSSAVKQSRLIGHDRSPEHYPVTQADRIQRAFEEARGIDTPVLLTKIRKEIATDLQNRYGDWSVDPHLEDRNILMGVGEGANRQVFKVTVELVAHGNCFDL